MSPEKLGHRQFDLYKSVTDQILSSIDKLSEDDQLIMPWHRSGLSQLPVNVESGNHYNGINILSLWVSAIDREFTSNIWGTYRQWKKQDAQVRKGEKSTLVIFYKEYLAQDDNGEEQIQRFARASWTFNSAQVDGFEIPTTKKLGDPINRIKAVDAYVSNTKAMINHGGDMVIPPFSRGFTIRIYAAFSSFCFGVIPPMPMLGRSLLYVQSQRVA